MEIRELDADLDIISALDDQPNDVGGMTPEQLKAEFDKAGNIIKKYINETLIEDIEGALADIKPDAATTLNGSKITDSSIPAGKLGSGAVLRENIADKAVDSGKLADGAVTKDKLGKGAVALAGEAVAGVLPVAKGGTGVTTVNRLRETMGVQPIELGGTGMTTAADARKALGITLENLGISYGDELPASAEDGTIFLLRVED